MENNGNPPEKPGGNNGDNPPSDSAPNSGGGTFGSSSPATYTGATEINTDTTETAVVYSSSTGAQNALLVSGGDSTLSDINITKTGDDSGDNSDFYGTNAAVLVYNGAILNLDGGSITTNGSHANALFAYNAGTINAKNLTITTSSNNSGGIMVTGGGTLNATDLSVTTSGNSSAAIRSDRGGGSIDATGGNYVTEGVGSPAIYSTADIHVTDAKLDSTASEGVVIEGLNSVNLKRVTLTDNNTTLNGNSETYKNIFIYQSMSGDAAEGTGTFTAENSDITTNSGDHFFITNTTAEINLKANLFIQNDKNGGFLRAQTGRWGTAGNNGGIVALNADTEEIIGDINVDSASTLTLNLTNSYAKTAFLGDGQINLSVSGDSIVVLTADSTISSLSNEDSSNLNIYANGHTLTMAGEKVEINESAAPESFLSGKLGTSAPEVLSETQEVTTPPSENNNVFPVWGYFAIGGGIVIVAAVIFLVIFKLKNRGSRGPQLPKDLGTSSIGTVSTPFDSQNGMIPSQNNYPQNQNNYPQSQNNYPQNHNSRPQDNPNNNTIPESSQSSANNASPRGGFQGFENRGGNSISGGSSISRGNNGNN